MEGQYTLDTDPVLLAKRCEQLNLLTHVRYRVHAAIVEMVRSY